jgi:hypothetical protein
MTRLLLILFAGISSAIAGYVAVLYAPAHLVDYSLIAIVAGWQIVFEVLSWNRRPKNRLLRIAFKVAVVVAVAWWLYPFDQPWAQVR